MQNISNRLSRKKSTPDAGGGEFPDVRVWIFADQTTAGSAHVRVCMTVTVDGFPLINGRRIDLFNFGPTSIERLAHDACYPYKDRAAWLALRIYQAVKAWPIDEANRVLDMPDRVRLETVYRIHPGFRDEHYIGRLVSGRLVDFGKLSKLLSPKKVGHAIAAAVRFLPAPVKPRDWRPVVSALLLAAEDRRGLAAGDLILERMMQARTPAEVAQ